MAHVNKDALVDKLCERLAVETGGVGIYKAAIAKIGDPTVAARLNTSWRRRPSIATSSKPT